MAGALRGTPRPQNRNRSLGFDGRDTGNLTQQWDVVDLDKAGENADTGHGGIGVKAEFTAGARHLLESLEGFVGDCNGDPDAVHLGYGT
jgi:hypothetical protein